MTSATVAASNRRTHAPDQVQTQAQARAAYRAKTQPAATARASGKHRRAASTNRIPRQKRASGDLGFSRPPRRRLPPFAIAAFGLALVIAFIVPALLSAHGASGGSALSQETSATSTPQRAWRRGSVPFLYQIDPQWANEPYAGGDIRNNGCGPTCLSMVYVALTGKTDLDPAAMAAFSERNGYTVDGMTAWALMTDGAAQLGITGEELSADADVVRKALRAGRPIICSVRPGDFTTTGHFIVLAGVAGNGELIVHDPNSARRSEQTWDVDRVLQQCANLWAFSA